MYFFSSNNKSAIERTSASLWQYFNLFSFIIYYYLFFNIDNILNDILEVLQLVLLPFNSEFVQRKCEIIKTNEKKMDIKHVQRLQCYPLVDMINSSKNISLNLLSSLFCAK